MGLPNSRKRIGTAILQVAAVLLLTAAIEWFYFGFCNASFSAPIDRGGDGAAVLDGIKSILTGNSSLLGWPVHQDLSAYSAQTGILKWLFVKLCGVFTRDLSLILDLYIFVIPLLNVLVCYLVLRHFKVRYWLAFLAALTFGFCPYVQYRLRGHYALAAIECIPIVFLLCMWCLEDPDFERPGACWFKYRRNWLALLFAWMIAYNGMVYYPFFSCFILCVTALCLLLRERRLRAVCAPVILIAQISGWLALGFVPTLIGMLKGYGNVATNGATRGIGGSLSYMLRIDALLLSPKGFGIGQIKEVARQLTDLGNESYYAYIGVVAMIGCLVLFVCAFFSRRQMATEGSALEGRLWFLSRATMGILPLAVSSGIGVLVNVLVPSIRCYNRISPFIMFCGVFAVALCLEVLLQRCAGASRSAAGVLLRVLVIALFAFGLYEQQGVYGFIGKGTGEAAKQSFTADEEFVSAIEQAVGEDAMIFQLPYMRSFENGPVRKIVDYDHLRGSIHSDSLRWSYGAMNDSENDVWYRETSQLSPAELVNELYVRDFSGIWLNLDGYDAEEGAALEEELCARADCEEPIRCADGHTIFIPLSRQSYWYSIEDHLSGEIREIHYVAEEKVIEAIRAEFWGDEPSVRYFEDSLRQNGTGGESQTIILPEYGAYQLHHKTLVERGEARIVGTVADESEVDLAPVGDHQIAEVPFEIKADTLYQVDLVLDAQTDFSTAANMVIDFYGGPGYDRPEQEASNFITEGKYNYTYYFNSGDVGGETLDVTVRAFVYDLSTVINLDILCVTELEYVSEGE